MDALLKTPVAARFLRGAQAKAGRDESNQPLTGLCHMWPVEPKGTAHMTTLARWEVSDLSAVVLAQCSTDVNPPGPQIYPSARPGATLDELCE